MNPRKTRARELYLQGLIIPEIAKRMNVSDRTIQRYKSGDAGTEQDWDLAKVPADQSPLKRSNVLPIKQSRSRRRRELVEPESGKLATDYDSLEGRLAVIDQLLDSARHVILSPEGPQMYAAAFNGFSKLLDIRDRCKPMEKTALLLALMDEYRNPKDLLADLKQQGWGRKSA